MDLVGDTSTSDFKARLQQTYDAHAEERDRMGEPAWRWPLCEQLIGLLKGEARSRLLEIRAGAGYTSRYFADRGLDVVAVDLSPAQVGRCRAKGLTAYHRDFYNLGFRMGSFDAVWAMNCLLHVPSRDLEDVLIGIREVLDDDGIFCMGAWGGIAEEGIYQDDFYHPARFFALRTDDDLLSRVESVFTVEEFTQIVPPERTDERLHVQFIRARRK